MVDSSADLTNLHTRSNGMVFDMNFNEYKGSPHASPQGGRYLPNGGLEPQGHTITMEEQGVYQDGRTFSDNQTGTVFIRISIPELKIQKCLQFELDETVWRAKQRILVTFAKDLKDSINYGLYCPPMNGRAGKFLDEERLLREYPLQGPIGFLEFKYKKRVYKMMHVNPRKLKQLHVKGNLRHFIDYVRSGNIEKVTKLTNKGLDPNFHDSSSGETPLTMAVSTVKIRCREMILCLAGGGAHLDFRNKRGIAALHKAVVVGNLEAVKTLLDLGVSPNIRDSHALTPLYFSVANSCNPSCTEMLLQERAFIGSVDDQGWAEIHHACQQGLVQHLEHLLFYGADMDIQNAAGNSPLHICALNNQESCLRVLLFRGANKDVLNYSNQTPYEVALIAGHDIMADIIDEHSSDSVVQFRDVPKYSTRRRDSVASMALFAMYRTRSDPRINASYMDGPGGMVSPSSSSHSFSHIHSSYTAGSVSGSRGSISGSRGTDSPCSMSISSNSSGPEEAQSVGNLHCNGLSPDGMRSCQRTPLYVMSSSSSHDLRQVRRHRPLSQYEIIRDRLTPKSYHDSLRSRLHGHKVYSSMYNYHNNYHMERRHSGYDLRHTEQWLNGNQHRPVCSHKHVCRNNSRNHCSRHNHVDNQGLGTESINTKNIAGTSAIYKEPQLSNNVTCDHGDKHGRNEDSCPKESKNFNDEDYSDIVTFDNISYQTKTDLDQELKENDKDLKNDTEVVEKYIYNEETDCTPSSQKPNLGTDNKHHGSPISKPPRTHRPNTLRCPSAMAETNHYANTKYAHSHTQISSSHMTTFQPIRSSASMGPNAADNHKHSVHFVDVEDVSLAKTGTDSVLDLELESVFICVTPYEAPSPEHLSLMLGDIVQVVGVTDQGLWEGRINGSEGWFPSNHVQEVKLRRKAGSLGDIIKGTRDFRDVNRNTLAAIQHNYR